MTKDTGIVTLRVYDVVDHLLAGDLRGLLKLFAPEALLATWTISSVKMSGSDDEYFEASGKGSEQLYVFAKNGMRLSGHDLVDLAKVTTQVIWGQFVGFLPSDPDSEWVKIIFVDSTFVEIVTSDSKLLGRIKSKFSDVQI